MAKETNQILGHGADADGIEEYDNPLPDWWLGLFFLTVVYGVGYGFTYHFVFDDSQEKQYLAEMAAAEVRWPTPEGPLEFKTDAATLEAGAAAFAQNCVACHGANLQGGIGPNLTDAEWIHGGSPQEVVTTITEGVPEKGMIAWETQLGPYKIQEVAAFILSKAGTAPVVADAQPDGSIGTPGGTTEATAAAAEPLDGPTIYKANCAVCHGPEMKGLVGPNLTDAEWIHGGELAQIQATITNGVPEKGMTAWGPVLGQAQVETVARFVHSKSQQTQ